MPRPNQARTVGAEDRARDNIRRFLDGQERSGTWFARQMNARGCGQFTSVTLHKILKDGRKIYVDEAIAMADILGVSLVEMIDTGEDFSVVEQPEATSITALAGVYRTEDSFSLADWLESRHAE